MRKNIKEYRYGVKLGETTISRANRILATQLKEYREEKDISLRSFAKLIGVSAPYLSDIEKSKRNISESFVSKLEKLTPTNKQ